MRLIYQQASALPLTVVNLILPATGNSLDPADRRGVTRLVTRLMQRGAGGLDNATFNDRLERLGANLSTGVTSDYVVVRLTTLTANLDAAVELFRLAIEAPDFDEAEFARLQAEVVSTWQADREEVKRLRAQEVYQRRIYADGPQGFGADGLLAHLRACTVADVRAQYGRLFSGDTPLLAVLTDLPREAVERRVLSPLRLPPASANGAHPWQGFVPPPATGRRVTLVPDKATNTDEVLLGAFSVAQTDPDWHIHRLIALVFGGDMNSRLFRVVRGERGLSYGASAWYEVNQGRVPRDRPAPFSLYTFPSAEHTAEAVPLMISLYEQLVEDGITAEELERARNSLVNAHPFMWDTPQKLLGLAVDEALYGLRVDDEQTHRERMAAVTLDDVRRVLREAHHPAHLHIVLLGDPARLEPVAAALPKVEQIDTIRYP